jgi:tetratricopeptide repeat protein
MWSRRSIEILIGATLLAAVAACSTTPRSAVGPQWIAVPAGHSAIAERSSKGGNSGRSGTGGGQGAQNGQSAGGPPPVPPEAKAAFDQALALARAGRTDAAEAQLASVARQYPQFCTPLVDLGILYRQGGNLDAAAHVLEQAVARDPHSAPAWTELGVAQRLAGKFQDAEQSYARAIAANPDYAPAYRDRGVLRDLYLDQPAAALGDFEQYRKLTGENKPVAMWIAELAHRTGMKVPPGPQPQARN